MRWSFMICGAPLLDMVRYDVGRLTSSMAGLRVPVMALQTTFSNERRERRPISKGQTTPYLDTLRACIPTVRIDRMTVGGTA